MRKGALRAAILQGHFVNAGPFLAINSPFFDPEVPGEQHDILGVRRELNLMRLRGIDAE